MKKPFVRSNQLLSLCGLNCGLCTMNLGGWCGGCGNGSQPCKISRCSQENGNPEYCFACEKYPCEKYRHIDDYDSFITHRNQKSDLEKAARIGIEAYNQEQKEKLQIVKKLLSEYNDGRKKTLFTLAANLFSLSELREAMGRIEGNTELSGLSVKEKSAWAAKVFQEIAEEKQIKLRLKKKAKQKAE